MAIVKSKHAGNFTVIPNEVFKQELSMKAIGLLTYLLSLPHDWIVYKTKLHIQINAGRHEIRGAFKELEDKGYVISVPKRNKSGQMEYEHIVYDRPWNGEPTAYQKTDTVSGFPSTVKPSTVNQTLQSTNTTKETSTNLNIKVATASFEDLTAYLKGEGLTLYTTVMAKRKDKEITPEAILAALNDKYPVYEFRDRNHVINAINACISVLEANKKKGKRDDSPKSKMVY